MLTPGSLLPTAAGAAYTIALVGGGGKTSLMFALAKAALSMGKTVITATTTHIRPPTPAQSPALLLTEKISSNNFCEHIRNTLRIFKHLTLGRAYLPEANKVAGLAEPHLDELIREKIADFILVEADGAAGLPLKAPAEHEPALPHKANLCLALLGMDGMALPMHQGVFRTELALQLGVQNPDMPPMPDLPARLALHERGLLRLCPPQMDMAVICNKADLPGAMDFSMAAHREAIKLYPAHKAKWYAASVRQNWIMELAIR